MKKISLFTLAFMSGLSFVCVSQMAAEYDASSSYEPSRTWEDRSALGEAGAIVRNPVREPVDLAGRVVRDPVREPVGLAGGAVNDVGNVGNKLNPFGARRRERREELSSKRSTLKRSNHVRLNFEPIRWRGHDHLAWLDVPERNDRVLINYGKKRMPLLQRDGFRNFCFVSPNRPDVALPKGLYYWESSRQLRVPNDLGMEPSESVPNVELQNHPQGAGFRYKAQSNNYRSDKHVPWEVEGPFEGDTVVDYLLGKVDVR